MKHLADEMSSGVSFFEQFKTDLEMRGEADIDIPVVVEGVSDTHQGKTASSLTVTLARF